MSKKYRIVTFVVPEDESLKEFDKWVGSHRWINNKQTIENRDLKDPEIWATLMDGIAAVCYHYFTSEDRVTELAAKQGNMAKIIAEKKGQVA